MSSWWYNHLMTQRSVPRTVRPCFVRLYHLWQQTSTFQPSWHQTIPKKEHCTDASKYCIIPLIPTDWKVFESLYMFSHFLKPLQSLVFTLITSKSPVRRGSLLVFFPIWLLSSFPLLRTLENIESCFVVSKMFLRESGFSLYFLNFHLPASPPPMSCSMKNFPIFFLIGPLL